MASVDPLQESVTIDVPPEAAFELFTSGFGSWWPTEFSWSQPGLLVSIGIDCRLDGLLTEIGPYGFRIDWGRVVDWHPPSSLTFLWQISADRVPVPDPDQASAVTVTFTGSGDGTQVDVTHDGWERHGERAQEYRDGFAQAWPHALDHYARAARSLRA